jgi:hypothetical protein
VAAASPSGLLKAGTILLLIGAILGAVGAVFLAIAAIVLMSLGDNLVGGETDSTFPATIVGVIYLVLAVLIAVGSFCGFKGWRLASSGNASAAFGWGLAGALLPPVQLLPLIGAILVKVSPEGEAAAKGP